LLHPPELQVPLFLHPPGVPPPLPQLVQPIVLLLWDKGTDFNDVRIADFWEDLKVTL
jgi:hypothetical protein